MLYLNHEHSNEKKEGFHRKKKSATLKPNATYATLTDITEVGAKQLNVDVLTHFWRKKRKAATTTTTKQQKHQQQQPLPTLSVP